MHSLLEKAIEIRRKIEAEDPFFFEDSENELKSVPAEERTRIMTQLDDVVSKNRSILTADKFTFKPLHKDNVIPAAVNIGAFFLIIIFSSVFLISFNIDHNKIIEVSESDSSAQSMMIRVLREESEEKLREKESEISLIQSRLTELKKEHNAMLLDADQQAKRIEADLRTSMNAELESERRRLASEGLSEEETAARLRNLSLNLENEYQQKLSIQMKNYEEEYSARQAEIDKNIAEYELLISSAETDAADLEKKLDLYRSEAEQSRIKVSSSEKQYAELEKAYKGKKLLTDQINAAYLEAGNFIKDKDFNAASLRLDSLEEYINTPETASASFLAERRGMDVLMISSLRKLINRETAGLSATDTADIEKAEKLTLMGNILKEGNSYYSRNDISSAGRLYNDAYSLIPELDESVRNTVMIEQDIQQRELMEAVRLSEADRNKLEQLEEKEQYRVRLSSSLNKFREGIRVSDAQNKERRNELVPLLQTKLQVRRLLTTEDAVNKNPGLYAEFEKYIKAYGRERENEGIEKGLNEVNAVIRSIINSDVSVYYQVDENEELEFYFLIDGLEKLNGY